MNIYAIALVIFLSSVASLLVTGCIMGPRTRAGVERLADPRPLPGELPVAGLFPVEYLEGPPFGGAADPNVFELRAARDPFDTGPILLLSDQAAALDKHEREVQAMIRAAETLWGNLR